MFYKILTLLGVLAPNMLLANITIDAATSEAKDYELSATNSLVIKLKTKEELEKVGGNPNKAQLIHLGNITTNTNNAGKFTLDSTSSNSTSQYINASFKNIGTSEKRLDSLELNNTFKQGSTLINSLLYSKGDIYLHSLANANSGSATSSSEFYPSSPSSNNTIVANILDATTINLDNTGYDQMTFSSRSIPAAGRISLYVNTLKANSATLKSVYVSSAMEVNEGKFDETKGSPPQSNTINITTLNLTNTSIYANSLTSKNLTINNARLTDGSSNDTNILLLASESKDSKLKVTNLSTTKGTARFSNGVYINANDIEISKAKVESLSVNYFNARVLAATAKISIKDLEATNSILQGNSLISETIKLDNATIKLQGINSKLSAKSIVIGGKEQGQRGLIETDILEGNPSFTSIDGAAPPTFPSELKVRGTKPTSLASINLNPFTKISVGGDLSISTLENGTLESPLNIDSKALNKALFNFSITTQTLGYGEDATSETTFNLASIESKGALSLPALYLHGSGIMLQGSLESFLAKAGLSKNSTDANALLLKENFLLGKSITINGAKVDPSCFSGVLFSTKDMKGSDAGKYIVGKMKVESNLTFIDFYLGSKQSEALSPSKLSLLATYHSDALYKLITSSNLKLSDIPSPTKPNTNPSSKDITTITPLHTSSADFKVTPETNLESLALKVGEYISRYHRNTPSSKIYDRLNALKRTNSFQKRQEAISVLKDLMPSDLNNAVENYALESNLASFRIVDEVVANSSLANSLRFLSKARFAMNDKNESRLKNYDPSSPFSILLDYIPLPNDSFEYIKEPTKEVYAQTIYQNIIQGERRSVQGYSLNTFGFVGGFNQRLSNLLVGANLTYSTAFTSFNANYNSLSPRLYLYSLDTGLTYQVSLGYSLHFIGTNRTQGMLDTSAKASYLANEFNSYALLGYKFELGKHALMSSLRLSYIYLHQSAYSENGEFGLKVPAKNDNSLLPSFGLNYEFKALEGLKVMVSGFIFYDVLSKSRVFNVAFLDDGINFNVASLGSDPFGGMLNLGVTYSLDVNNNLALSYAGTFKSSLIATTLSLRYGYRF
ncbi:hypothetical protein BKH43_01195 [Helicobacter sp. 13S00401-1]|uniref:autotransporter outer membrane beta-barrel domain-containing protein n=1 Tax=Helicobacter sp. 13S00401-1 TaxID=1905758 RepID=UPI000BA57164|nr:autotransporter outer membrane beta-barrel domain-containing protein [Helicobacter sp. 13S00401-1]PAF51878.1 hypothetical protein BKH43_01195 [Helicobacter sp. 13S00401-1]